MCAWELGLDANRIWPEPVEDWAQIEAALDEMNNFDHWYLCLSGDKSDIELIAHGGNQGRVYVLWTDYSGVLFGLLDPSQTTSVDLYVHDKLRTDLKPMECVDKSLAKQAFKHFYETLERDKTLHWVDWSDD